MIDKEVSSMTRRFASTFMVLANLAVFAYSLGAPRKWF
jgi:hypothetical protein